MASMTSLVNFLILFVFQILIHHPITQSIPAYIQVSISLVVMTTRPTNQITVTHHLQKPISVENKHLKIRLYIYMNGAIIESQGI